MHSGIGEVKHLQYAFVIFYLGVNTIFQSTEKSDRIAQIDNEDIQQTAETQSVISVSAG